ncbi:MAG: SBBP repeat-containing protein [Leptolyngbya sp. IPPAS B-1204]|nr:SBBP repeat-containing protein [Elainella sp. C42_A2020_010]
MPRDIAKSTLAAAKPLNLGTSLDAFKGVLGTSNRDDLFRFRFDRASSFNLDLATDKGGVLGVQVFSLKGAKKRVLRAIGRKAFSTLKPSDIKKFLQPIANQTFANGKDGTLTLNLPAGEFYLRFHQRRGRSSYGAKLAAQPLASSAPNTPGNSTPQPVPTALNTFSRRWLQQFGTSGNDYTYGTAVDRSGNLYVAGVANAGSGPAGDGFIAKYAVDGTQLWRRSIDTPGADVAFDVAVDDAGNYYVTGATVTGSGSATNSDVFVTKYNSDGLQQWIKTIATTVDVSGTIRNGLDAGLSLALNGNNLYISGLIGAFPLPSLGKAFIAKYDATTGAVDSAFGGAGTGRVEFGVADASAAVDLVVSNGVLYTTGITGAAVALSGSGIRPAGGDAFVSAFDGVSGATLWSQTLASNGTSQDYARGIALFGSDLYITGQTSGSLPGNTSAGGRSDAFLAKYNAQTGTLQWVSQFGSNGIEESQGIAIDSAGKIYITGETDKALFGGASGKTDIWVAQYDSSGNRSGSAQFGTNQADEAYGIVVDAAGNVYLAGQTQGVLSGLAGAGKYDAWVAQYGVLPTG